MRSDAKPLDQAELQQPAELHGAVIVHSARPAAERWSLCRTMSVPDAKAYRGLADLAKHQVRAEHYEIVVAPRPLCRVAVIALYGGCIEPRTSDIARAIAGDEFDLYLFEGIRLSSNYAALHLTTESTSRLQLRFQAKAKT